MTPTYFAKKKKKKKKKNKSKNFVFLGFSQILLTERKRRTRMKVAEFRCASTGMAAKFVRRLVCE